MADTQVGMEQVGTKFEGLAAGQEDDHVPKWKTHDEVVQGATRLAPKYTLPSSWRHLEGEVFLVNCSSNGSASRELFVRPLQEGGLVFGQPGSPVPVEVASRLESECYLVVEDHRRIVRIHTPLEGSLPEAMAEQQTFEAAQAAGAYALQAE